IVPQDTVDITMVANGVGSGCQATPIENTALSDEPGFCRVSLYTAFHCVADALGKNSPRDTFLKILAAKPPMSVAAEKFVIHHRGQDLFGREASEVAQPNDSAII